MNARALFSSAGAQQRSATPHRMAVITVATLASMTEGIWSAHQGAVMQFSLWIVAVGSIITTFRRSHGLSQRLKGRSAGR